LVTKPLPDPGFVTKNSKPRVLISAGELQAGIQRLAKEISAVYEDGVVLVAVLKGSVPFLADLVRRLTILPEVDFLAISHYAEGTGRVRIVKDLDIDICGRDVILVEDIVDTGLTLTYILGELRRREPKSLEVCALLDKAVRRIVPTPVRFAGFEIDDDFVLGYGLDFAQIYRNLDHVIAGDLGALRDDPSAHVSTVYGR
jgi:hypoxanthine phosphoribosyltransferase